MMRIVRVCLAIVCAIACTAAAARADIAPRWSDDQLAGFASAIVSGRVTAIGTGRDIRTGATHTYVTVAIDRVFKGDISERSIVVKQLGGRIGDDTTVVIGQAEFTAGEDGLLFLDARRGGNTPYTTPPLPGEGDPEGGAPANQPIAAPRG